MLKTANYSLNLLDIDLTFSSRASYLYTDRQVMSGIIKNYCPSALYAFRGVSRLRIITDDKVNIYSLARELKVPTSAIRCSDYDKVIDDILTKNVHRFKITMNTIKKRTVTFSEQRKKEFTRSVKDEELEDWFTTRLEGNGIEVLRVSWGHCEIIKHNDDKAPTHTFYGLLKIKDKTLFEDALTFGIGRKKIFGCGLLLLDNLAA
jgi:hypothetical protein